MPQDPSATPRRGKTRANDRNQSPNEPPTKPAKETPDSFTDTNYDTLAQLKEALMNEGGLIKNATDARKFLNATGLSPLDTTITSDNITHILLTLVATSSTKRTASERIPEKMANIIKATALLLDDITNTQDAELGSKPGHETNPNPCNSAHHDIKDQLETNANLFKQAATSQAEATDKANALLARMEKICEQSERSLNEALNTAKEVTKSATPYKDALING